MRVWGLMLRVLLVRFVSFIAFLCLCVLGLMGFFPGATLSTIAPLCRCVPRQNLKPAPISPNLQAMIVIVAVLLHDSFIFQAPLVVCVHRLDGSHACVMLLVGQFILNGTHVSVFFKSYNAADNGFK